MKEDFSINKKSHHPEAEGIKLARLEDVLFRQVVGTYIATALDSLHECRLSARTAGIQTVGRLTPAEAKALDVYDLA
jgi:hypothetical protein